MIKYDFCFVIGTLPLYRPTGGDDIIFQLAKRLKNKGFSVCILVIKNSPKWIQNYLNLKNIDIYNPSFFKRIYYHFQGRYIYRYVFPIIRKIKRNDYDFSFFNYIPLIIVKDFIDIKDIYIDNIIASWWATAYFVADDRIKARNKYYLIQNTEDDPSFSGDASNYAKNSYNLKNLRKIVINHDLEKRFAGDEPLRFSIGIDYDLWHYNGDKENMILFPLRTEEYKGAKYMLEAADILHKKLPAYKLVAFGNMEISKVPRYIDYYYRINNNELIKLYHRSKIFILPSIVEGFSLTALQAMASNCGIVSTDSIGIREFMINCENAIIVNPKNPDELVNGVLKLINQPELLEKIIKNSQITVEKYSYENMYKQFITLINKK